MKSPDTFEMNYQHVRDRLNVANEQMTGQVPCCRGMAECCHQQAEVLHVDARHIIDAFASGAIPDRVRRKAVDNALDPKRAEICPFLGQNNECTIYEYRPLVCINFGIGARIRPQRLAQVYEKDVQHKGDEELLLGQEDVTPYACECCGNQIVQEGRTYPLSVAKASSFYDLYRTTVSEGIGVIDTRDLVLDILNTKPKKK